MRKRSTADRSGKATRARAVMLPLDRSIAAKVRSCSRLYMRLLERRIAPHGISIGMWFFLRALWEEDGLGQSALSERAGVMGPTTVPAMERMERMGLIERRSSAQDKRKIHVFLTARGRALREAMLPTAAEVVQVGTKGLSREHLKVLEESLDHMLANLRDAEG